VESRTPTRLQKQNTHKMRAEPADPYDRQNEDLRRGSAVLGISASPCRALDHSDQIRMMLALTICCCRAAGPDGAGRGGGPRGQARGGDHRRDDGGRDWPWATPSFYSCPLSLAVIA
jgi:hypothetical protein